MTSPYDLARQQGYSDEEISDYLAKQDPSFSEKYQKALQIGYQPGEVISFYHQSRTPKEGKLEKINRNIVRGGLRAAETVLGAPRALGEFGESLVPEELLKKGAEKIGLRKPVEKGLELAKKYAPYKLLPKSEQVREVSETLFGKGAKPKNDFERKSDNLVSDFVALSMPIPGAKFKLLKPALLALGGNLGSEVVGQMGGSEKQKAYTKLGTYLVGSLINPKGAENLKNELYQKARESIAEGASVPSTRLEKTLDRLETSFKKGGVSVADEPALKQISNIRSEIKEGKIDVDSLQEIKKKINIALGDLYDKLGKNKPGIKTAKAKMGEVARLVDDALKEYGKENPQWEAYYRPANEVHGVIEQSKKMRNWLGRVARKFHLHNVLPMLGFGHMPLSPIGQVAAGAAAATGGTEIATRFAKSPVLRKYYTDLLKAAATKNAVAAKQNLQKLEKELKKTEEED